MFAACLTNRDTQIMYVIPQTVFVNSFKNIFTASGHPVSASYSRYTYFAPESVFRQQEYIYRGNTDKRLPGPYTGYVQVMHGQDKLVKINQPYALVIPDV